MPTRIIVVGSDATPTAEEFDKIRSLLRQESLMDQDGLLLIEEPTFNPDFAEIAAAFAPAITYPCVERSLPPGEIRKRQKEQRRRWRKGK